MKLKSTVLVVDPSKQIIIIILIVVQRIEKLRDTLDKNSVFRHFTFIYSSVRRSKTNNKIANAKYFFVPEKRSVWLAKRNTVFIALKNIVFLERF
jgi:hypothetical protein